MNAKLQNAAELIQALQFELWVLDQDAFSSWGSAPSIVDLQQNFIGYLWVCSFFFFCLPEELHEGEAVAMLLSNAGTHHIG